MRHNDIVMAATSARSYSRHWRAKKLSWNAIGKIRYLMDGAIEYMDEVTLCYPQLNFNKLRTVLGFKQDSELTELVEQAEAFYIVRQKDTGEMVAFMTPMVPHRFVPTPNQVIEQPSMKSEVFEVKANLVYDHRNNDKISDNLRVHKNGINMKMLLKENAPAFHAEPRDDAFWKVDDILNNLINDDELFVEYFNEFNYHYQLKYKTDANTAGNALYILIQERLLPHMACRVGIQNWPEEAVKKWIKNYFGAKRLPFVITEARELWQKEKNRLEVENKKKY